MLTERVGNVVFPGVSKANEREVQDSNESNRRAGRVNCSTAHEATVSSLASSLEDATVCCIATAVHFAGSQEEGLCVVVHFCSPPPFHVGPNNAP